MQSIGVIGGGAWGTALAQVFAREAHDVMLWARESEVVGAINETHENSLFLPDIALSEHLKASNDLSDVAGRDILLLVTPAQYLRATLVQIKEDIDAGKPVVICSKGIELESGLLLSEVAHGVVPKADIAVLTGPTFAREVAQGKPAAVTIAAHDHDVAERLQHALGNKIFRPYISTDVIGTQLGGAIKNVIAIACGIVHGKQLGESARAALVTRGVAEIARLATAMGARRETLMGMCGFGDLVLTCSSMQSRNFSLGAALGEGKNLEDILETRSAVTEGVHTAQSTLDLAKKHAVDMPITEAVKSCLVDNMPADAAIEQMLNRPFGYEISKK